MKRDRTVLIALLLLIGLVVWLIVLSINRSHEVNDLRSLVDQLRQEKSAIPVAPTVINGKTPILGVDYFNGQSIKGDKGDSIQGEKGDAGSSAYDLAVSAGFKGTLQEWLDSLKVKGDKGDPAPELQIDCKDGHFAMKYSVDVFWQSSNIKCEVSDE